MFTLPDLRGVSVTNHSATPTPVATQVAVIEDKAATTTAAVKENPEVVTPEKGETVTAEKPVALQAEKPRTKIRLSPSINEIVESDISKQAAKIAASEGVTIDSRPALTLKETVDRLRSNWTQIITFWHTKGKVIIATALTNFNITDDRVIIMVANLSVKDEILSHKQEIEMSIKQVLNVRATIEVIVSDVPQSTRPRTLEQIYTFMVAKNKNILKLHDAFDLTI